MLIAGIELSHHGPGLSAQIELGADRRMLELLYRALANDELAQAWREPSAGDDAYP